MAYTLRGLLIDKEQVGQLYHIGIGTTTPGQAAVDNLCGYLLVADQQLGRFLEKTDLHSKDQLTQYSSAALIDRDLVNTPRVSDGDFSGGALQQNYLDPRRFWDSDLDPRTPGYLFLNPAWARQTLATGLTSPTPQSVAWLNDVYTTFQEANFKYYNSAGTSFTGAGIVAKLIDTDGESLFIADGVSKLIATKNNSAYTNISIAIGAITQMWAVNQGTAGRFIYYTTDGRTLQKVDLASNIIGIAVPLGGNQYVLVDVVPYLAGVAILTKDPGNTGFDVWYHDGATLQRIIRVSQYFPSGMTICLGQLFVTAQSVGQFEAPVLMQIAAGSFQILLRAGTPFSTPTVATVGEPEASGQYVYFPLFAPQLNGISSSPYLGVYDVLAGSYWHLNNLDVNDWAGNAGGIRSLACSGRAAAFPVIIAGTGSLQYQVNTNKLPAATQKYAASGWLCSSRIDFNTPSIAKLLRRVVVHHAPLNVGEQLYVETHVEQDPMGFTTTLGPSPALSSVTNSTVGSVTTILTLPARTIGKSMYLAMKLTAGTGQLTTPNVFYFSVEVAVPWTWEGWFDLTHKRRLLNGDVDSSQTVQDLYFLLHNAWENAQPVTCYHPNGNTYVAAIESLEFQAFNPTNASTPEHPPGVEWWCHVLLRDSLE
jgi:hypothetical protein